MPLWMLASASVTSNRLVGEISVWNSVEENGSWPLKHHLTGGCQCAIAALLPVIWIGRSRQQDCDSVLAYHFDFGTIDGVDVTGRTNAMVSHIPNNYPERQFARRTLSRRGPPIRSGALLNVYGGKLGGRLPSWQSYPAEVSVSARRSRVREKEGRGTLSIGPVNQTALRPHKGWTILTRRH
jgi:hypothetical protein